MLPESYMDELLEADIREMAIHRRVSRLSYSRRCAEASAVQAHLKQGIPLAPGMEIGYMVKYAKKWEVEPERTASEFDAGYYGKLLEKAWGEVAYVFFCSVLLRGLLTISTAQRKQGLSEDHPMR